MSNTTDNSDIKHWWVGVRRDGKGRDVFEFAEEPSHETHGLTYKFCIGPFKMKEAAEYMAGEGYSSTDCLTPNDAERIVAARIKAKLN